MKTDHPYYEWQRYSAMTVVSGSIRFLWIFAGIPWRRASNDSGVIENAIFRAFSCYVFAILRNEANITINRKCK